MSGWAWYGWFQSGPVIGHDQSPAGDGWSRGSGLGFGAGQALGIGDGPADPTEKGVGDGDGIGDGMKFRQGGDYGTGNRWGGEEHHELFWGFYADIPWGHGDRGGNGSDPTLAYRHLYLTAAEERLALAVELLERLK